MSLIWVNRLAISLFFILFQTSILSSIAQNRSDSIKLKSEKQQHFILDAGFGGIIAHNAPVAHLAQSHPRFVAFEYSQIDANKEWVKAYHFPNIGFSLQYVDYQNPQLLGSSLAGLLFMEQRLSKRFSYRLGSGLVYNFHPFNLESNPKNLMLGSDFALIMHGQVAYYQPIFKNIDLRAAIGITHFSNGAFTQPNSGINVFYTSLGLVKKIGAVNTKGIQPPSDFVVSNPFSIQANASFSVVEKLPVNGPKYPVYQGSIRGLYQIGRKSSIASGFEFIHNESRAQLLREKPWFGKREGRLSFLVGHEMHISNWSLITDFGVYIIKNQDIDPLFYQKYGFRYYATKNLNFAILLKVHRSKAECLELGLGYTLVRFKKSISK